MPLLLPSEAMGPVVATARDDPNAFRLDLDGEAIVPFHVVEPVRADRHR